MPFRNREGEGGLGGFLIHRSSIQSPALRTFHSLRFGFHIFSCRLEHTKDRIFFHLMDRYSLQHLKNLNNKPIPLSRDVLRVQLHDALGASRCTPRHQFVSSSGYILLFHCFTWLLRFLPDIGHLCCLSSLKKSVFSVFVCANFSFICNQMQKVWSVLFK